MVMLFVVLVAINFLILGAVFSSFVISPIVIFSLSSTITSTIYPSVVSISYLPSSIFSTSVLGLLIILSSFSLFQKSSKSVEGSNKSSVIHPILIFSILSLSTAIFHSSSASPARLIIPFSLNIKLIVIAAKISIIIMVTTNAISVIP